MYFSVNYNPKVKKKTLRLTSKKKNLKKFSKIGHGTDLRRSPHQPDKVNSGKIGSVLHQDEGGIGKSRGQRGWISQ